MNRNCGLAYLVSHDLNSFFFFFFFFFFLGGGGVGGELWCSSDCFLLIIRYSTLPFSKRK